MKEDRYFFALQSIMLTDTHADRKKLSAPLHDSVVMTYLSKDTILKCTSFC